MTDLKSTMCVLYANCIWTRAKWLCYEEIFNPTNFLPQSKLNPGWTHIGLYLKFLVIYILIQLDSAAAHQKLYHACSCLLTALRRSAGSSAEPSQWAANLFLASSTTALWPALPIRPITRLRSIAVRCPTNHSTACTFISCKIGIQHTVPVATITVYFVKTQMLLSQMKIFIFHQTLK